jgi:SAM-dependent methyltransferase
MMATVNAERSPGPTIATPSDETILRELLELAERRPSLEIFRALASSHQYARLYRLMRRHVPPGSRVLDWGAGNGHFSYFLQRAGYRATGFSFHSDGYREFLPDADYAFAPGSEAEPVALPFASASFDAVGSVGVLEHVRETGGSEVASLREIGRVLRPGGVFVCFHFPNRTSWIDLAARAIPGKHFHTYRYARTDILRLVGAAGLEPVEIERYGMLPRNAWHRAPRALRRARVVARAWDALDVLLALPLGVFCQNYCFVARAPMPRSNAERNPASKA